MELTTFVVAMVVAGLGSGQAGTGGGRIVTVYLVGGESVPLPIRAPGEYLASRMFGNIGVRLDWRHRLPAAGRAEREQAIVIQITAAAPAQSRRAIVADALPYEGSMIHVYYESMRWAEKAPILGPRLFAHVLVHEIAHNLQQVARHSDTGIMKGKWTSKDYQSMARAPLRFEIYDVELIYQGLASRAARRAAAEGHPL